MYTPDVPFIFLEEKLDFPQYDYVLCIIWQHKSVAFNHNGNMYTQFPLQKMEDYLLHIYEPPIFPNIPQLLYVLMGHAICKLITNIRISNIGDILSSISY